MRTIDRLYQYLELKHLIPYNFERNCGLANGYLHKQSKGRGGIGSEIIEKIHRKYSDLSLSWLITGSGMILTNSVYRINENMEEERVEYLTDEGTVRLLKEKIQILENALADKEKIIRLLESAS